jgi:hypothetical protein
MAQSSRGDLPLQRPTLTMVAHVLRARIREGSHSDVHEVVVALMARMTSKVSTRRQLS